MTDPVSPREALIERLRMAALSYRRTNMDTIFTDAADALAADEALRAENGNLQAQYEVARVVATEFMAERNALRAAAENCECPHDPDGTCAAPREIAAADARAVAAEERAERFAELAQQFEGEANAAEERIEAVRALCLAAANNKYGQPGTLALVDAESVFALLAGAPLDPPAPAAAVPVADTEETQR